MGHFISVSYVLQTKGIEAPLYLQFWEIMKSLLALQVDSGQSRVCLFSGALESEPDTAEGEPDTAEGSADSAEGSADSAEGSPDTAGEPNTAEGELGAVEVELGTADGEPGHTVLAYEARLTGEAVSGRSEFVLVQAPGTSTLPIKKGLEDVGSAGGLTPLLVAEVKAKASFDEHIWQPLACAVELMKKCPSQPEMWVILTDIETWDFVRVKRLPCTMVTAAAGGRTAPSGAAATAGVAAVVGGAAAAGAVAPAGVSAPAGGAALAGAAAPAGAAAGGDAAAVAGGVAAAVGTQYLFKRMDTVNTYLDSPSDGYLQLLAVLHHIIYPKEKLGDLLDRVEKSRGALQTRAEKWVRDAKKKTAAKAAAEVEAKVKAAQAAQAEAEAEAKAAKAAQAEAEAKLKAIQAEAEAKVKAAQAEAEATVKAAQAEAEGPTDQNCSG
ncbi:hypothetical protein HXX76_008344 [Chlamydomonas incerta]|uniref:Uncharacterized protein n=1 Tax=Chlamydomonas incerta TaxID=51695 RepID=A0A835SXG6_CHLIN|nr:hypothetical protein HXX76_008344 [Chlamydomonas incerta]|eukprot:KAG2433277.1 hypothetical protein HXX76_008344 [Chlamydomonas incerta]